MLQFLVEANNSPVGYLWLSAVNVFFGGCTLWGTFNAGFCMRSAFVPYTNYLISRLLIPARDFCLKKEKKKNVYPNEGQEWKCQLVCKNSLSTLAETSGVAPAPPSCQFSEFRKVPRDKASAAFFSGVSHLEHDPGQFIWFLCASVSQSEIKIITNAYFLGFCAGIWTFRAQ